MKKLFIALVLLGGIVGMAEARRCTRCPKKKCEKKCCVKPVCEKKCCPKKCEPKCCTRKYDVQCMEDASSGKCYSEMNTCMDKPDCITNHSKTITWVEKHPATQHITWTCPAGTQTVEAGKYC